MVSMKIDPKKREEQAAPTMIVDRPMYPYGLNVQLDEEALEKLGMTALPKVDGELLLTAIVKVVSVSSNEHTADGDAKGNHKHRNVSLQITDMDLEAVPKKKDAADELYAKG